MLAIVIQYRVQSVDDGGVVILSSVVLAIGIAILHWFLPIPGFGTRIL